MNIRLILKSSGVLIAVALVAIAVASAAPGDFPAGKAVVIKKGAGLSQTATILKDAGIIRSRFFYKAYAVLQGGATGVKSGQYLFEEPQSALRVAQRLVDGEEGYPLVKITVPEGLASSDIGRLIKKHIPSFDTKEFSKIAKPQEGYLFPDTYFFYENMTPKDVVDAMRANFDRRIGTLAIPLGFLNTSFHDVLTMASILEEEATSTKDRQIIAGILWKRIEDGMLLQVDPPFFYIFGKTSAELTRTDLSTSSPYNTYRFKGLPPTPIDNPSLDAIYAAVHPIDTPYWFFLAGRSGKIYYAKDHDGHIANRDKYLN